MTWIDCVFVGLFISIWLVGFPLERLAVKRRIKKNAVRDRWARSVIEGEAAIIRNQKESEVKRRQNY